MVSNGKLICSNVPGCELTQTPVVNEIGTRARVQENVRVVVEEHLYQDSNKRGR